MIAPNSSRQRRIVLSILTHVAVGTGAFVFGWHRASNNPAETGASSRVRRIEAAARDPLSPSATSFQGTGAEPSSDDPAAFVAWAKALPAPDPVADPFAHPSGDPFAYPDSEACRRLRELFHRNRSQALAIAMLARTEKLWDLFRAFANEWGKSDFFAAWTWAKGLDRESKQVALYQIAHGITGENAAEAAKVLAPVLERGPVKRSVLLTILNRWSERDPQASFRWLRSLSAPEVVDLTEAEGLDGSGGLFEALRHLIEAQPWEVAGFLRMLPASRRSSHLLPTVVEYLVAADPSRALEWANSLPASGTQLECLRQVWSAWASISTEAATTAALAQEDPRARQEAIGMLARHLVPREIPLTLLQPWIDSLPPDVRPIAEAEMIVRLPIATEAAERLTQLATSPHPAEARLPALAWSVGYGLAAENPAQAIQWAGELPPGPAQVQAAKGVVTQWMKNAPAEVVEWVASLPAGDIRDGASAGLAEVLEETNPEAALGWASSIAGDAERLFALRGVVNCWKDLDSEAARQAIEISSLQPVEKHALLAQLDLAKYRDDAGFYREAE